MLEMLSNTYYTLDYLMKMEKNLNLKDDLNLSLHTIESIENFNNFTSFKD